MEEQLRARIQFLRSTTIFTGVDEAGLTGIAALFNEFDALSGEYLCKKGEPTEGFFLIFDGEAVIVDEKPGGLEERLLLESGDFAGEEALFYLPNRQSSVVTKRPSTILFIANRHIPKFLEKYPQVRDNMSVLAESRSLSQKMTFSWLGEDEVIHVISRKHPALLLGAVSLPILFFIAVMLLAVLVSNTWPAASTASLVLMGGGFAFSLAWLAWNIFNWSNDYYILTNKRMVWVEKVAGIYDSRQEAPLSTIMSVGTSKTRLGNILGYGDVTVRTFIGPISFKKIAYAPQIAAMVEAYWQIHKKSELSDEGEEMRKALIRKLTDGGDPALMPTETLQLGPTQPVQQAREATFWEWLFADFLKLRFENGGVITYRKHWLVLVKHTWLPLILLLGGVILGSAVLTNAIKLTNKVPLLVFTMLFLAGVFLWFFYNFIDWRNDIYQLTEDQVIDIERKPLGKENRRSAPLESILSIEFERKGIFAIIFNFGTVKITVGNTQLTFDNVFHPSDVQQDIFSRMGKHQEEKRRIAIAGERERVSEWFKIYHDQVDRPLEAPHDQPETGDQTHKLSPRD